jgi:nitrogen regulatory protein PII
MKLVSATMQRPDLVSLGKALNDLGIHDVTIGRTRILGDGAVPSDVARDVRHVRDVLPYWCVEVHVEDSRVSDVLGVLARTARAFDSPFRCVVSQVSAIACTAWPVP